LRIVTVPGDMDHHRWCNLSEMPRISQGLLFIFSLHWQARKKIRPVSPFFEWLLTWGWLH